MMISNQACSANPLKGFLEKYSEAYWEVPVEQLQYQEIWLERRPDLLVVALPIEDNYGKVIRNLQSQTQFSVLIYCPDFDQEALEMAWVVQPQAVLVLPVTEPQLAATMHLIRLSKPVEKEQQLQILSNREREVLQLVLNGFTSKEIGLHLFVSMNTVNTHKRRIKEKLGVRRWVEVKRSLSGNLFA